MNLAFIGQFAETGRDCIFTTEFSGRTPMEAVYQLLAIDRGVPEVFNSTYDVRSLLAATSRMNDGKEIDVPGPAIVRTRLPRKIDQTQIGELLKEYTLLGSDSQAEAANRQVRAQCGRGDLIRAR